MFWWSMAPTRAAARISRKLQVIKVAWIGLNRGDDLPATTDRPDRYSKERHVGKHLVERFTPIWRGDRFREAT